MRFSLTTSSTMADRLPLPTLLFMLAIGMAGAATVFSPHLLATLVSSDGQLQPFTIVEIQAWRAIGAAIGLALLGAVAVARMRDRIPAYRPILNDYMAWQSTPRAAGAENRWLRISAIASWTLVAMAVLTAILSFSYQKTSWFSFLALESGLIETMQAAGLLIAGILLFRQGWQDFSLSRSPLRLVGLSLGLLLMVGTGEEISWGQHWLGFGTPESIAKVNVQGEFNLHNIGSYWVNNLQAAFFLLFIGIWPSLGYFYPELHYVFDRLSLPIAPRHMLAPAVIGTLMDEHTVIAALWQNPPWRLSEGREFIFAGTMLLAVMGMRRYRKSATRP